MKRHAALHPLSHDHQHVLAAALRLRRAGAGDDLEARRVERDSFVEFGRTSMAPHFVQEEQLLDRAVAVCPDGELVAGRERMVREHEALQHGIDRLAAAGPDPSGALLVEVGELVTAHVRFEERELFEALQRELGAQLEDVVHA